ncbi:MAG: Fe-S cluster assembly scaffold protein NifU [Caldisericia bacterium]|nr:Fe-S cluster assembly scaffold protein NifU [Caldisericia bacterium]
MYNKKVKDHFMNPRNVGKIKNPDGTGEIGNPKCGDVMHIEIKVEKGIIADVKFQTFGCAAAIASSSMVTEIVKGMTIEEAEKVTNQAVADALEGLPPEKMHCSNLAADALLKAIQEYKEKQK